ncbi:hypothetical protein BDV95DRAFT_285749 [Massariosphaeria phaeospora]|uniref:Uncharacterized protein n=1 Tax=Massariosphaeria phaeospora TaxID=100035 RepID=A0A7C8IEK3_9PLEO|nr:hypothetical protein BDV95DRAFT_285749 [Massariosphaeria phaeospora]
MAGICANDSAPKARERLSGGGGTERARDARPADCEGLAVLHSRQSVAIHFALFSAIPALAIRPPAEIPAGIPAGVVASDGTADKRSDSGSTWKKKNNLSASMCHVSRMRPAGDGGGFFFVFHVHVWCVREMLRSWTIAGVGVGRVDPNVRWRSGVWRVWRSGRVCLPWPDGVAQL